MPLIPDAASVRIGARRDRIDADVVRAEIVGHEPHVGFQARLRETHDVVARQCADCAEVAQRQHGAGAALHAGAGCAPERGEAVAGDIVRDLEPFPAHDVDVAAFELIGRRVGDRVDQDVEAVPALPERLEERVDLPVVGHVQRQHDIAAELAGHLLDATLELVGLIVERELRALLLERLRDPPGDRAVARKPDDNGAFTGRNPIDSFLSNAAQSARVRAYPYWHGAWSMVIHLGTVRPRARPGCGPSVGGWAWLRVIALHSSFESRSGQRHTPTPEGRWRAFTVVLRSAVWGRGGLKAAGGCRRGE